MSTKMKFKCTSCQHIFEHDAYQKNVSVRSVATPVNVVQKKNSLLSVVNVELEIPNGATSCPHMRVPHICHEKSPLP